MEKAKGAYGKIVCAYQMQSEPVEEIPMIKGIVK